MLTTKQTAETARPGTMKSLNRTLPGPRIMALAGMAIGVQTATEEAMKTAHRWLSGSRESDGFSVLADKRHLELSLEALVIDQRFTALFTDDEANEALQRLLAAGYRF